MTPNAAAVEGVERKVVLWNGDLNLGAGRYQIAVLATDYDASVAREKHLRLALNLALDWIHNWDPPFTQDPDWPADHQTMLDAALAGTP